MYLRHMESMSVKLKKRFVEIYPESEDAIRCLHTVMVPRKTTRTTMMQVIEEVGGLPRKHHRSSVSGEMVRGKNGNAVMIYQISIRCEDQFVCTFYHELGHAFDSGVNGEIFERITQITDWNDFLHIGYGVWSEFIADSLMYKIAGEERKLSLLWGEEPPAHLQSSAKYCFDRYCFSVKRRQLYDIGQYFALGLFLFWKDGDLDASDELLGINCYKLELVKLIREMFYILGEQMNNPDFWRISESTLKELGSIYAEMKQFYIDDDRTAFDFFDLDELGVTDDIPFF
jgi:hypothetical protein